MTKIIRHLTAISRCGTEYRKQYLNDQDVQVRYARCLLEICERPGISQEALSRRLLVDKSTVTRQCVALEEAELILRTPSPDDRRSLQLFPSEKALALLPQLTQAWDSWETLLTEDLTQEEKVLASELLLKLKTKARQWMEAH
ncbi:MAG: MarR family transcriptional regulator [Oscillospiraceae bacterium]|nr:MarR family transcriptional regulator [Oscillospiraceae bacterium]